MKDEKYTGFPLEDLLEDQEFITIVKNIQTNEEWEDFLRRNAAAKDNIILARKIIELFKTHGGELAEDKKFRLWNEIRSFNKENSKTIRLSKIKRFSRIAASLLILVSVGSALYFGFHRSDKSFQFSKTINESSTETPLLVLSNGTEIKLSDDISSVEVVKGQDAVLVNSDSLVQNLPVRQTKNDQITLNEVSVPYGKKTTLTLEDGTKVWLNAGSHFAFPQRFEKGNREVFLEGEAYFEVTKKPDQPFIVSTRNIDVKVFGTKFNLSAYPTDNFCETVLLEGSVSVQTKGNLINDKTMLAPNQKARFLSDKNELTHSAAPDAEMYIAWINGWYQFSNESFAGVMAKLERYYNVKFSYDQALDSKAFPVSGKLNLTESLAETMTVLSKVAKVDFQIGGTEVIVKERK